MATENGDEAPGDEAGLAETGEDAAAHPEIQDDDEVVRSIVVCFRWNSVGLEGGSMERAVGLVREADTLGARLVSFSPFEVALRFNETDLDEAASFAARTVRARGELQRAGIAAGEITTVIHGGAFVQLGWGPPVTVATALARVAQAGDVVIDETVELAQLRVTKAKRELTLAGKPRSTYLLDIAHPLINSDGEELVETNVDDEPIREAHRYSSMPPPGEAGRSMQLLELAREALIRSDSTSIDQAVAELNLTDDHADVVERLAGMLALTRGAKEEGLRLLRRAAEGEQRPDKRARSVLAYAIGVAAAGRQEDALIEALCALSIARSQGDRGGEKACARFLAQLSYANHHPEAASAWEHVAQGTSSGE